jgi:hypothetical protein
MAFKVMRFEFKRGFVTPYPLYRVGGLKGLLGYFWCDEVMHSLSKRKVAFIVIFLLYA